MYDTLTNTFDDASGYLFHANSTNPTRLYSYRLGYYKKHPPWKMKLSDPGMLIIDDPEVHLWEASRDGTTIQEAAFSFEFTMSIYQPKNPNTTAVSGYCLIFAIIPQDLLDVYADNNTDTMPTPIELISYSCDDTSDIIVDNKLAGNRFIIRVDEMNKMATYYYTIIRVQIAIKPLEAGNSSYMRNNYSVSIQYKPLRHNMTVQVKVDAEDGQNRTTGTGSKHPIYMSNISSGSGLFSLSSSMGQLFQLHTWESTIEWLPDEFENFHYKKKGTITIILSSVLGSVAVTVATAAVVYCYFNSKYRGWKKELDQLAKAMQVLPGVPTQFSFSDIRRATNNFHETTQLGRGGFGSVYRCKLPSPKKGEALLEVAVKRFSRDDNRRYEDFLAEVSVINRLRHKNIVPLVGWSYNKGEPLLVYEYMPNGSLDQHLFRWSGGNQQQPTPISRWDTRYNMVKDIATGLHYVHHEYEPRVLHRDIKANNIMIDSGFQGRLGDFGLACVVAKGKESYTDIGAPGTLGFRAPEYIHSGKATTKSDIFAFGVLVLEIVTGKIAVDAQHRHLADWVWHLHKEGRLPDAIDPTLTTEFTPTTPSVCYFSVWHAANRTHRTGQLW
ncbi:hypothetical protein HU200_031153 [Digitaria exilis]|uniref:Protein kinase domain-containing protein n=1 Tax=Digitaria exilis TaxID=1010633 RepID=A0A835EQC7_9POAL|nr:hypothetical protein HU200_031153 [Digitaria exilis]